MEIDTSGLTKKEKMQLLADLKIDLFQARETVRVWETAEHPFYPGRFCEGLMIELDNKPYTILRIVGGYEDWKVHLAEPDAEELQWYATRKKYDTCPTCGYSVVDYIERANALNKELALKIHLLLHNDWSGEVMDQLFDEIRTIDSKLWPRNEEDPAEWNEAPYDDSISRFIELAEGKYHE